MSETVNQEPVTTAAGEQQEPRTFTQAEVNSIVADRLTRERTKYADYDDLKTKAQQFDTTKAVLDYLNTQTRKSIPWQWAALHGIEVEQHQLRVHWRYDVDGLLRKLEEMEDNA